MKLLNFLNSQAARILYKLLYDLQYARMAEITEELDATNDQLQTMIQEKLTADNIYQLLLVFDQLYNSFSEIEKKDFMRAFIDKIELYPEKQPDGNWLKSITFNFPIPTKGGQVTEYPLESRDAVETVMCFSKEEIQSKKSRLTFPIRICPKADTCTSIMSEYC